ncbi:MAG TPA: NAD(P)/FAD-dependent oxidoreductase [Acidimicrobiales bacterium]|nr:NAD(P)/FAD-dependent oxidoreductase [Acidimicrobiales bacterium]
MAHETSFFDADVVIVGGRCAGAATARLLARSGLRVVVLDRATFPSDTRSTHALAPAGSLLLRQWGLLDDVLAARTPTARTIGVQIGTFAGSFPVQEGWPGSMAPRRTVLDALLVEAARAAGAEVREATTFRSVIRDHRGSVVGIIATDAGGASVEVRAPLVIGADGVGGPVAAALAAPEYAVSPSRISGVYAYYADVDVRQNELAFAGDHAALAFPTNDELVCVAAVVRDDRLGELVAGGGDAALAVVAAASPRLQELVVAGRRASRSFVFRPVDNVRRVPFGDGWALVGDAGLYRDPITGQGIADAFVSAQLLADAVAVGLGGGARLDEALAAYHLRRDDLLRDAYDVACELSRYEWHDDSLLADFLRYREAVVATGRAVEEGLWGAQNPAITAPPALGATG